MIFIILYWWMQYLWRSTTADKEVFAFLSTFELGAEIFLGVILFGVWWSDRHG